MAVDWTQLAQSIGYEDTRDMLEDMYHTSGMSINDIADRLECGAFTVSRQLEKHNIIKRQRGGANNTAGQSNKLHRLDQRIVLTCDLTALARLINVSRSLCYKYRRQALGGKIGFLYPNTRSGVGEVRNAVEAAPPAAPNHQPEVHRVLPATEG